MDKDEMLRYFDSEERNRGGPDSPTGYIQSEIVMVAKTTNKPSSSSVLSGGDSPSPLSVQSKLDWSPGEVIQPIQSMDVGDDLASMLSSSGLDSCSGQGDVESLLGPGFRPQLPSQPLQHIDLSFVDSYNNPAFYRHE
ncbi:hypothetical protein OSTOST_01844 [Ostertagia ostertagi]